MASRRYNTNCGREVSDIKAFTLRLSDKLHKAIKYYLIEKEMSMQEYIITLIKQDMKFLDQDDDLSDYTKK